ncbi:class I SAM-dependent DNA methyltransferase [Clostridium sp. Mt-5]|uniref:site-specific DNA-methyltransferase (adenine-specific) n=1 Tax=Clostridium moutaii TaxID=3240932 RepID=A0ABV4BQS6_9CLOT
MVYEEYLDKVKDMIKDLKAMCAGLGLANTGDEYKIISELFTYKFLNDKLQREYERNKDEYESYDDFVDFVGDDFARIYTKCTIDTMYHLQSEDNFNTLLDNALIKISEWNSDIYSIETASGNKKPLFEPLAAYIRDEDKEMELAKRSINILADTQYKFDKVYDEGWDYFSSIFEFLIKDYNKDSGKYAEYFTPVSAGNIMAEILYNDTPTEKVTIYDPAAGSGTLLLCMANVIGSKNCMLYSQDISQKSSQFLRMNMILNRLSNSLNNVIEGNTMTNPYHKNGDNLKKFDFIVSNPPFNMDFSADVETLKNDKYDRFFAGIPNGDIKEKEKMAIYQVFLQHIIASLNEKGKAAVVVPNGFITAQKGIPLRIRKKLVDKNWLRGIITMPQNIFATTGTKVSLLFIDKTKTDDGIFIMDASDMGTKTKVDDIQRTILSSEEIKMIIECFKDKKSLKDFCALVSREDIKNKNYFLSLGTYIKAKKEVVEYSVDEFNKNMEIYTNELKKCYKRGAILEQKIIDTLEAIKYE